MTTATETLATFFIYSTNPASHRCGEWRYETTCSGLRELDDARAALRNSGRITKTIRKRGSETAADMLDVINLPWSYRP